MARNMKTVNAPRSRDNVLVIAVDPLKAGRGHRVMPRGAVHATDRQASRARSKQQWQRQLAREGRGGRERME